MRTELITEGPRLQRIREAWNALHTGAAGTVFQTYDWLSAWWTVFGGRLGLRILALWQDGDLAGLVPCYIDRNALGAYARAMGEHAVFGAYAPLVRPEAIDVCAGPTAEFFRRLLTDDRCGFIDFHHVPSHAPLFDRLPAALRDHGCSNVTTERSLPRLVVQLPASWEEYVKSLTSHERHFARMLARFEKQADPPIAIRVRRDPSALDDLIRLHSLVWEGRGQRGYFRGRDGFADFFRLLLPGLLERQEAAFYTVEAGGEVVATTVTFFTGAQSCAYLSGRLVDHAAKKYSPGKALLTAVIRDSIAAGYRSCDLMEGLTEYKFRVGGGLSWFSRHTIFREGIPGLKGRAFLGLLAVRTLRDPKRIIQRFRSVRRHGEE